MTLRKIFLLSLLMALAALTVRQTFASTRIAAAASGGAWTPDGYPHDGAPDFGRTNGAVIASIPGQDGFWALSSTGEVYARGAAKLVCGPNDGDNLSKCTQFKQNSAARILAITAK